MDEDMDFDVNATQVTPQFHRQNYYDGRKMLYVPARLLY
jgi:hypothetical protein